MVVWKSHHCFHRMCLLLVLFWIEVWWMCIYWHTNFIKYDDFCHIWGYGNLTLHLLKLGIMHLLALEICHSLLVLYILGWISPGWAMQGQGINIQCHLAWILWWNCCSILLSHQFLMMLLFPVLFIFLILSSVLLVVQLPYF